MKENKKHGLGLGIQIFVVGLALCFLILAIVTSNIVWGLGFVGTLFALMISKF